MMKLNNLARINVVNFFVILITGQAYAMEFDSAVIENNGGAGIDLSQFENDGPIIGNDYLVNILVNGHLLSRNERIQFFYKKINNENVVSACVPESIIGKIGLEKKYEKKIEKMSDTGCVDFSYLDKNITEKFDSESQELSISIPQAYFITTDEYWDPPAARTQGIAGIILDYNIYDSYVKNKNQNSSHILTSYGMTGFNLGVWRFRANYNYSHDFNSQNNSGQRHNFKWGDLYAYRDLAILSAKLLMGDTSLNSNIFDNVQFRGLTLFTDARMLPPNLRGYAPVITGTANSNAKVVISQNNNILKTIQVPPGPFVIDQISGFVTGTLDVRIEEENGSVNEYQVVSNSIPFLTRKNQAQYRASSGKLLSNDKNNQEDIQFITGELSYGLTSNLSLYGGIFSTINSKEFKSINIGIGNNFNKFGALSLDVTHSSYQREGQDNKEGNSYRFNYAKNFEKTDSTINLTGYRFSDRNFTTIKRFMDEKEGYYDPYNQEKNLFTLSLSQNIKAYDTTVSLVGSSRTYWNNNNKSTNLGANAYKYITSGRFQGSSINVGLNYNRFYGLKDKNVSVSVVIPLEKKNTNLSFFTNYNESTKKTQNNINYFSNGGPQAIRLGVRSDDGYHTPSFYGAVDQTLSFTSAAANVAYGEESHSLNASANGSVTLTSKGIVFHQQVAPNQPRLIIDAGRGMSGVPLMGKEIKTNWAGLAVVTNSSPYQRTNASINLKELPEDLNLDETHFSTTMTEGAIGYESLKVIKGDQILSQIRFANNSYPPFGSIVLDKETNAQLAMISEQGEAYIGGITADSQLIVSWNSGKSTCIIDVSSQQYSLDKLNKFICL